MMARLMEVENFVISMQRRITGYYDFILASTERLDFARNKNFYKRVPYVDTGLEWRKFISAVKQLPKTVCLMLLF